MEFKANFHHVSIRVQKDPEKKWCNFLYLAIDDAIIVVLDYWLVDWHNATNSKIESSKTSTQRKKEEAKLNME